MREVSGDGAREAPVCVHAADAGVLHRRFVRFPYALYRDDPCWVAPLRMDERHRWSPRHNASLETRWVRRFVATRSGRVTGRIAVAVDPVFAATWERGTGLFGFFECADDEATAAALLAAAEAAARSRGMQRLLGPINLTPHDETGLLLEGFDTPPTLQSPYNPPYYRRLLEEAGYDLVRQYHAYTATPDDRPGPAIRRLVQSAARGTGHARGVRVRSVDLSRWIEEARILHRLYNAAFADVWGFVPISWDEFRQRGAKFRTFAVPDLIRIAECEGEPVGFGLTLPDVNEALQDVHGRLLPFGWLRLLRTVPRIRTVRFVILAVLPAYRGRGIAPLIAVETQDAARRLGITRLELSLVQSTNTPVQHVIGGFSAPVVKTFGLFARSFAPAEPGEAAA